LLVKLEKFKNSTHLTEPIHDRLSPFAIKLNTPIWRYRNL